MIFNEIASLSKKIKEIQEKMLFLELQATTPKSPTYSDMPKGGGNATNPIEQYAIKKEELQSKIDVLNDKLESLWNEAEKQMQGIDEQTKALMLYRFKNGFRWEKCSKEMQRKYPDGNWNLNKCFRKYREVLKILHNFQKNILTNKKLL